MYQEIKRGIIKVLQEIKDIDIIFIKNEDVEEVGEYFYVIVKPIEKRTDSLNLCTQSYLIDILYDKKDAIYHELMEMAERIDCHFRPILEFETFSVIVNAQMQVIDMILHYSFHFSITYEVRKEKTEEMMGQIEVRKGV